MRAMGFGDVGVGMWEMGKRQLGVWCGELLRMKKDSCGVRVTPQIAA